MYYLLVLGSQCTEKKAFYRLWHLPNERSLLSKGMIEFMKFPSKNSNMMSTRFSMGVFLTAYCKKLGGFGNLGGSCRFLDPGYILLVTILLSSLQVYYFLIIFSCNIPKDSAPRETVSFLSFCRKLRKDNSLKFNVCIALTLNEESIPCHVNILTSKKSVLLERQMSL